MALIRQLQIWPIDASRWSIDGQFEWIIDARCQVGNRLCGLVDIAPEQWGMRADEGWWRLSRKTLGPPGSQALHKAGCFFKLRSFTIATSDTLVSSSLTTICDKTLGFGTEVNWPNGHSCSCQTNATYRESAWISAFSCSAQWESCKSPRWKQHPDYT